MGILLDKYVCCMLELKSCEHKSIKSNVIAENSEAEYPLSP